MDQLTQTLKGYVEKLQANYPEYKFEDGNRSKFGDRDKEGIMFVVYPNGEEKQYMIPSVLQGSISVTVGGIERDIESYERAQSITTQANPAYRAPKDAVVLKDSPAPAIQFKEVATTYNKNIVVPISVPSVVAGNSNFLAQTLTQDQLLIAVCTAYNLDVNTTDIHIDNGNITVYNKTKIQMK